MNGRICGLLKPTFIESNIGHYHQKFQLLTSALDDDGNLWLEFRDVTYTVMTA